MSSRSHLVRHFIINFKIYIIFSYIFFSLLLQHESNPVHKNKDAKTPYELAPDKPTRKVFRKFMAAFPDKYNYIKVNLFYFLKVLY